MPNARSQSILAANLVPLCQLHFFAQISLFINQLAPTGGCLILNMPLPLENGWPHPDNQRLRSIDLEISFPS